MSACSDNNINNLCSSPNVRNKTGQRMYLGQDITGLLKHFGLLRLTDILEAFPILDLHDLHTVLHDDINRSILLKILGSNDFTLLVDATKNCLPFMWLEAKNEKSYLTRQFIQPNMKPRLTRASDDDCDHESNHYDEASVYAGEELNDFLKTFKLEYLEQILSRFPVQDLHDLYTVLEDDINKSMLQNSVGSFNFSRLSEASNKSLHFMWMKLRRTSYLKTSSSFEKIELLTSPTKVSDSEILMGYERKNSSTICSA
jgi:hypothetical protein